MTGDETGAAAAGPGATHEFEGRVVLVSGGSSGIGRAAALAFARRGASVVVAGRDRPRGEEVAAACAALGAHAAFVAADLSVPDAAAKMVERARAAFGRLDIAFNNAGIQEAAAPLAEQPDEVFEAVFGLNVRAVFLAMKAEIAAMRELGAGVIINNASVSGSRNPNGGLALYSASKAAVLSMTRTAALEYGPAGIRINAISPGRVDTPLMQTAAANLGLPVERIAASLPARRVGRPEDAAEAVVWLASDAASFVFGHDLAVDGGFLAS